MKILICIVVFSSILILITQCRVEFTNAKCIEKDKSYLIFKTCIIKAVNRTYKYFSVRAEFPRRKPISNISVAVSLFRKANGYKPFLYNITIDACQYLKKRNNPVISYFHTWFEKYSTLNKTCPYGMQDEFVDKLPASHVDHQVTNVLPIPSGDYAFHTKWYFYNTLVAIIQMYSTFS